MKLLTAIVQPCNVGEGRETLAETAAAGITVTEVKGFGRRRGHTGLDRIRTGETGSRAI